MTEDGRLRVGRDLRIEGYDHLWSAADCCAALRPIYGPARILRFLHGLRQKYTSSYRACVVQCNGMPALVLLHGDTLDGLLTCEVHTGHVVRLMLLRNSHKLDGLRQAMQKVSQHPLQQPVTC